MMVMVVVGGLSACACVCMCVRVEEVDVVVKTCGVAWCTRCPRAGDVLASKRLQRGGALADPHLTSSSRASKPPLSAGGLPCGTEQHSRSRQTGPTRPLG